MTIRPAYGNWALYNQRLCDAAAPMTAKQLAVRPSPERWPI